MAKNCALTNLSNKESKRSDSSAKKITSEVGRNKKQVMNRPKLITRFITVGGVEVF